MAKIVRVEWLTYWRSDTKDWLSIGELGKAFPLQQRQVKTVEFPEILPRLLIGVILVQSKRLEQVRVEVEITYLLMHERTMSGIARTYQRYQAFHSLTVKSSGLIEIPIALDADENYFSRAHPDLALKSLVLRARLLAPSRSPWRSAKIDYLYTPWGD